MDENGISEELLNIEGIGNVKIGFEVISYTEMKFTLTNLNGEKTFIKIDYANNEYIASENVRTFLKYRDEKEYNALIIHLNAIGKKSLIS